MLGDAGMDDPLGAIKLGAALRRSRAVIDRCMHHGSCALIVTEHLSVS